MRHWAGNFSHRFLEGTLNGRYFLITCPLNLLGSLVKDQRYDTCRAVTDTEAAQRLLRVQPSPDAFTHYVGALVGVAGHALLGAGDGYKR